MNILGHTLSTKAKSFVNDCMKHIKVDIEYGTLPDNSQYYGNLSCRNDSFLIEIKASVPDIAFEAILCHEMYHAYQVSIGFPQLTLTEYIVNVAANYSVEHGMVRYCNRLYSSILDLSADDAVRSHGLDDSYVMSERYEDLEKDAMSNFIKYDDLITKNTLAIGLILDFHSITIEQKTKILQALKLALPDIYELYYILQDKVDKYGYDTPEGCFNIFGSIITHMHIWSICNINYRGLTIGSLDDFNSISTVKMC